MKRIAYEIKNDSEDIELLLGKHQVVYDNTKKEVNMYSYGYTVGILSPRDEVTDGVIHFGIVDGPIDKKQKQMGIWHIVIGCANLVLMPI